MLSMKILLIVLAYFIGSIPTGVIVARVIGGVDPRSQGSGNIGATNVLRTLGKKAAILTLAGDVVKGLLPVLVARAILSPESSAIFFVAGAAILGHDFSIFLRCCTESLPGWSLPDNLDSCGGGHTLFVSRSSGYGHHQSHLCHSLDP
jgi:acyl-phosphate glycerol 3-phosphate acyltransferase